MVRRKIRQVITIILAGVVGAAIAGGVVSLAVESQNLPHAPLVEIGQ